MFINTPRVIIIGEEKNKMAFYVNNKRIDSFHIKTQGKCQESTAKQFFIDYSGKLQMEEKENADFLVSIEKVDAFSNDTFSVELDESNLVFRGGQRGVIYAVFSFLERIGFRFFTPDLETCPEGDIKSENFFYEESCQFIFRDILSIGATDKTWSLKQKLNSNLWNARGFTVADGGSYDYAGIPAHSLTGEYLLKPYVKSNPEYFSLKDGKRITNWLGQICMTNEDAIEATVREVFKLLEENPDKNIVSVSMGDNENFCECEKCKAAVKERGLTNVYFDVICKIARRVKEKRPDVLIHTLAYINLIRGLDFQLEDNILVQYCHAKCSTHAIADNTCKHHAEAIDQMKEMSSKCSNLQIWHYTNCFKYELFEYPFIHNFLSNMRFFAECGATGVMNEGMHRYDENTDFATTYELRSYLLAKIMWNPHMSEKEYERHISEFCQAFYGRGYEHIIAYLNLYKKYAGDCASYDANKIIDQKVVNARIIQEEHTMDFINQANSLLNQALEMAEKVQRERIEKLKTCVLYYELFWTMRDVLDYGTEDEKKEVIRKNKELIERIFNQRLVITFWGQSRKMQNEELAGMGEIPPSEWNYKW